MPPQRTVEFPENQYAGELYAMTDDGYYILGLFHPDWGYFCEAYGEVNIPKNVQVKLDVNMTTIDMSSAKPTQSL